MPEYDLNDVHIQRIVIYQGESKELALEVELPDGSGPLDFSSAVSVTFGVKKSLDDTQTLFTTSANPNVEDEGDNDWTQGKCTFKIPPSQTALINADSYYDILIVMPNSPENDRIYPVAGNVKSRKRVVQI